MTFPQKELSQEGFFACGEKNRHKGKKFSRYGSTQPIEVSDWEGMG